MIIHKRLRQPLICSLTGARLCTNGATRDRHAHQLFINLIIQNMVTGRNVKLKTIFSFIGNKITTSNQSAQEFRRWFEPDEIDIRESMHALFLNQNNCVIGHAKISEGSINGTTCDIRLVCKYAIDLLCSSVILAHNHPSGNLKPSEADKLLTEKTRESLKLFDVSLLDHIILTENNFYSFADNGQIN